jgi:hypothetical protein
MQSRRTPALLAVLVLAVGAALFVALSDDGDDQDGTTPVTTAAGATETGDSNGEEPEKEKPEKPEKPQEPEVPVIEIAGGEPAGGLQELEFTTGERLRFVVRSDADSHVHLHGYDVFKDVPAGGKVEFDVPADIEGVFEVEIETTATPLAEITVKPG